MTKTVTEKTSTATKANLNGSSDKAGAEIEDLKADFKTLQDDVKKLMATLSGIAKGKSNEGLEKGSEIADDATEKFRDTQAYVEKQVRSNPLAAVGIALGAGYILAALRR
jgi:ElaB/YqjD/DUF883 family membrane-anchored ribosome-binding protein